MSTVKTKSAKQKKIYVIKTQAELDEVNWLISEGDFKSLQDYIIAMTKIDFGYKPRIDQITKITGFSDL
jgi:DNA-binding sugar fermentation-stimulating protein